MIRLLMTCAACPEQYDAYLDGKKCGYLRLRHGRFTVHCPSYAEHFVYEAYPEGDGVFEDHERDTYLRHAVDAILRHLRANGVELPPPNVEYEIVRRHD